MKIDQKKSQFDNGHCLSSLCFECSFAFSYNKWTNYCTLQKLTRNYEHHKLCIPVSHLEASASNARETFPGQWGEERYSGYASVMNKHEFNVFRKTIAILADSQHSDEWKQTLREHEEKKDRVIEKYKTKCEQKRVRTLTVIIKNILLNSLSNHQFSLLQRGPRWVSNKRDLKIRRRRRQRELQKSNRFD